MEPLQFRVAQCQQATASFLLYGRRVDQGAVKPNSGIRGPEGDLHRRQFSSPGRSLFDDL